MKVVTSFVVVAAIAVLAYFYGDFKSGKIVETDKTCPVSETMHEVRGQSLVGVVEEGTTILIEEGYYKCHKAKKNEIVAYRYAGNPNLIIKIIKGVPGDSLKINPEGQIVVNNEILATTMNEPYITRVDPPSALKLYEGAIPEDAYLILGNIPSGGVDSTRFGLVHISDVVGKVKIAP